MDSGAPLFFPRWHTARSGFLPVGCVRDLNGDGKPDLLVGSRCARFPSCLVGAVEVLLGVGDGTFQEKGGYGTAGLGAGVAIADVNGDGKPDMLATGCAFKDCFTGVVTVHTETATAPSLAALRLRNGWDVSQFPGGCRCERRWQARLGGGQL